MTRQAPDPTQDDKNPEPRLPAAAPSAARGGGSALLVLEEHGQPSQTLRRAAELAGALGLELEVLRVLRQPRVNRWLSGLHLGARLSLVRRSLRANQAARAWCDEVLGVSARTPVHVRTGDYLDQAARFAAVHDVGLVLVPPREGRIGARIISLAGSCRQPVLVLRGAGEFRSLVAATDLEDNEYPVLCRAVELGQRLDARVTAVHNVTPIACVLPLEAAFTATMLVGADTVKVRMRRLVRAAEQFSSGIRAIVANQPDTVGTIVSQVPPRADALVVVGTRTKPWLDRLLVKSIAAEVVDRSPASVLVTPIRQRPWFDDVEPWRPGRRGTREARGGGTCAVEP